VNKWEKNIKRLLLLLVMAGMTLVGAIAQNAPDKIVVDIESMPRKQAIETFIAMLDDANLAGRKTYKNLIFSLEEMVSEPTWDYHNEELFALLIRHAANASCLNNSDKARPRLLLEIVNKNVPGNIATDIEYETTDGTHCKLSDSSTPYTLVYFNDPECLSCAKVKERLDTCSILKDMVNNNYLTIIGIYPYDNIEEWKIDPFPNYIINGWDYNQDIEGKLTYELMTLPLFYLLDSDKRVILKNEASLNRLIKAMNVLKGMEDSDIEAKLNAVFSLNVLKE